MTYEIRTSSTSALHVGEVLDWLQENVGALLWSKPIIEYHGRGWHMKRDLNVMDMVVRYLITIDDPKLAVLTELRWG